MKKYLTIKILITTLIFIFLTALMPANTLAWSPSPYCDSWNYSFCDEFDGVGMDTTKWQDLNIPSYNNHWSQLGNGLLGGRMRAVTIPEFRNFIYQSRFLLGLRSDLVFRFKDLDNYYSVNIRPQSDDNPNGAIIVSAIHNGEMSNQTYLSSSRVRLESNGWYDLKVIGMRNRLNFYLNGKYIGNWQDDRHHYHPVGSIGFKSGSVQRSVYDYVKIRGRMDKWNKVKSYVDKYGECSWSLK